ncbi:hypothetical protein Tco_0557588, partial [Tanacetum coccineum]
AWITIETRLRPLVSSTLDNLNMDDDSVPDEQVHSSDDEDIGNDHIPKVNLKTDLLHQNLSGLFYNTLCFQVFDDVNKCTIYFKY